jgi:Reverse transcriptase (RNA-dependent DNA polymerase)
MDRELKSLDEMGAFEEADLPAGDRAIGLKWVFDRKTDANGVNIPGKEKARLVAQGFNQRPGQYDETYAPVAKMASVRILLAWAAVHDLEIFQFDCKTAFLHAKLRHPVYGRQIPGFPLDDPKKVLRILAALYGLRQSSFEFYTLFFSLLVDLGMIRCEVDHGVFVGTWISPPDPSISMLPDGRPLVLYVPIHVDDGLGITNSPSLYRWFLSTLAKRLHIVDLGSCSKFLSIVIMRDRPNRRLWLSSHVYVAELLEEWNLTSCRAVSTPFPTNLTSSLSPAPANALPDVSDVDLIPKYQRLVGCLLYLAIATRPDLSYYAMWLGQFNAKPTRAHFLAAKHVLRYLSGTRTFALCLGTPFSPAPSSLQGFMQSVGCSDADWASDSVDRKSISGYSFYFLGSLVSWSAVKQKSIALSSTEAEYYAMTHAFKEALWMRVFLGLLSFPVPRPFPILSDNQAACALSHSPAISARSKHIDIRHHFIRSLVQDGSFSTTWIPTEDMPADIFTKSLPFTIFSRHRDVLGLFIPPSLV